MSNLMPDLDEGEIFWHMTELHATDQVQHNSVWLMKILPYWLAQSPD